MPSAIFLAGYQLWELRQKQPTSLFSLDLKPTLTAKEIEAMAYLNREARDFPLILSYMDSGLVLPAFAPVRAVVGHVTNVKDNTEKVHAAAFFFSPAADDATRRNTLARYNVDYVWWGKDEDRRGGRRPGERPYLHPVFDNGAVRIYRVLR
jgi:hypothetical protein